jgi:16S rRNA C967 or C1407 C5-methylase (RsmB/RsmF family)
MSPRTAPRPTVPTHERLFRLWLGSGSPPIPLDRFLSEHVHPKRIPNEAERRGLTRRVTDVMRWGVLATLGDWLLERPGRRRLLAQGRLDEMLDQFAAAVVEPNTFFHVWTNAPATTVFAWVGALSGESKAPQAIAEVIEQMTAALATSTHPAAAALRVGVPPAWVPALQRRASLGLDVRAWLASQNTPPPLWIRANQPAEADTLVERLKAERYRVEPTPARAGSFAVKGQDSLFVTPPFREGLFEIQDLGSQLAGDAVEARPGERIWDACAGAGGKTLLLAAATDGKGAVLATDTLEYKLEALRKRVRRAEFSHVRVDRWDGGDLDRPHEARAGFDAVLVDAPCTSAGTWRRNPDARLRFHPERLSETQRTQASLLSNASVHVRPGGRLVYVTCSWLVEENEDIVSEFLGRSPNFEPVRGALLGPPTLDSDTFFVSVLRRRAGVAAS